MRVAGFRTRQKISDVVMLEMRQNETGRPIVEGSVAAAFILRQATFEEWRADFIETHEIEPLSLKGTYYFYHVSID